MFPERLLQLKSLSYNNKSLRPALSTTKSTPNALWTWRIVRVATFNVTNSCPSLSLTLLLNSLKAGNRIPSADASKLSSCGRSCFQKKRFSFPYPPQSFFNLSREDNFTILTLALLQQKRQHKLPSFKLRSNDFNDRLKHTHTDARRHARALTHTHTGHPTGNVKWKGQQTKRDGRDRKAGGKKVRVVSDRSCRRKSSASVDSEKSAASLRTGPCRPTIACVGAILFAAQIHRQAGHQRNHHSIPSPSCLSACCSRR